MQQVVSRKHKQGDKMTTYKSYVEAKIANPDRDIFTNEDNDKFQSKSDESFFIRCLPSHHCINVDQFLHDGHRFVNGDICIRDDGDVVTVKCSADWNDPHPNDVNRFVLRAAALDKPKRVVRDTSKIKIRELKCFAQVADVIGKAKAQIELFKVLSVSKECNFTNDECIVRAFSWSDTPQGGLFWTDVDKGINPYDKTLQDQR